MAREPLAAEQDHSTERSTRQKRAVANALRSSDAFRSAQDLFNELRTHGETIGLTTVYKQLHALVESGEVDVLRSDDGELLYRKCLTTEHHHHLSCRICGHAVEVEVPELEAWAERVGAANGFNELTHTLELIGVCADCASQAR